jgi:hypothetical protein
MFLIVTVCATVQTEPPTYTVSFNSRAAMDVTGVPLRSNDRTGGEPMAVARTRKCQQVGTQR